MNNKKTKKVMCFLLSLILFCGINLQVHAATVYTEGYFHYVIEDNAITITEYFGSDAEVTVPSVIAGYPVDTLGHKAFANADSVEKINLPDTIMTVEQGAIKDGQTVIYNSNTDEPTASGGQESYTGNEKTDNHVDSGQTENNQNPTSDEENKTEGTDNQNGAGVEEADVDLSKDYEKSTITDGKGNQISVDSEKHLISILTDGTITVLDDKNTYEMQTMPDGSTQIKDKNGDVVTIDENGKVVIPSKTDETEKFADKTKIELILGIGIVAILVVGVGVWYYRKKKR